MNITASSVGNAPADTGLAITGSLVINMGGGVGRTGHCAVLPLNRSLRARDKGGPGRTTGNVW